MKRNRDTRKNVAVTITISRAEVTGHSGHPVAGSTARLSVREVHHIDWQRMPVRSGDWCSP
jgi:hypothetical protein